MDAEAEDPQQYPLGTAAPILDLGVMVGSCKWRFCHDFELVHFKTCQPERQRKPQKRCALDMIFAMRSLKDEH